MASLAGRPAAPPPRKSSPPPKIYVPPPVQHVSAGVIHPAAPPVHYAPTSTRTSSNPRGVAIPSHAPAPTVNDRQARQQNARQVRQGTPRGTGYTVPRMAASGTAAAKQESAYLRSPGYRKALIETFMHQPTAQKVLILNRAAKLPKNDPTRTILANIKLPAELGSSPLSEASIRAQTFGIDPSGVLKVIGAGAKDLYNMPLGTLEAGWSTGTKVLKGFGELQSGDSKGFLKQEGSAAKDVTGPYVQFAKDPKGTFEAHPVNTLLMLLGAESGVGEALGGAARLGAFGGREGVAARAASYARPDLQVGNAGESGSPITESRDYSKDIFRKALQKAYEKTIRARGHDPDVSRPAPRALPPSLAYAMNVGTEAKLQRITDEMTSVSQMESRSNRARILKELSKHAPKGAGRHIVSHILQGVIRTPELAAEDIAKEISRLKAAQTGHRTFKEIMNRRQVKALDQARKEPGAIDKAFEAADKIRPVLHAQDAALIAHGLLDPHQAMRSKLIPYAMAHMGATYDHERQAFVAPGARRAGGARYGKTRELSTDDILDHLRDDPHDIPDPAYVRHVSGRERILSKDFYQAYKLARGQIKGQRKGELFRQGAYDHTFEQLAGQVASRSQSLTKAELHDRVINRLGITLPHHQLRQILQKVGVSEKQIRKAIATGRLTPNEADAIAYAIRHDDHGNEIAGRLHLTPISATPTTVLNHVADLQHPNELGDLSHLELRAVTHAVDDATKRIGSRSPADARRNVVLVPTAATDRFVHQFARSDDISKTLGKVTQQFRRTVLPYSTHWWTQTATEAGLRALLTGNLSVRKYIDGMRLYHAMNDTEAGRAARAEMVGSTHFGLHDTIGIHNPNPGLVARASHAFPVTRVIVGTHNRFANVIMHSVSWLERQARIMGLGKLAHKEAQAFGHSWRDSILLQSKTIEQLAKRGEADPALVAKFGRSIDNTFGKYGKFTPRQRSMIQAAMPFLPWYMTAAKFVFWNLPAHHPVASALLASMRQTLDQDIKDGKEAPLGIWAAQALARFTPFGIFTPPSTDPSIGNVVSGANPTDVVLPQATGAYNAWEGLNPFGDAPLKGPPTADSPYGDVAAHSDQAGIAAAEQLFETLVPLATKARQIREGGRPSYGTSTLLHPKPKPGTKGGTAAILHRTLNPFYSMQASMGKGPPYGSSAAQKRAEGESTSTASGRGGSGGGGLVQGPDGAWVPAGGGGGGGGSGGGSGGGLVKGADGVWRPG